MEGIFSPEAEQEFTSYESNYTGRTQRASSEPSASSESDSESERPVSPILDQDQEIYVETRCERRKMENFIGETCGCKLGVRGNACSAQFSKEVITQQRENCFELEKGGLDMAIFGQLQVFTRSESESDEGTSRRSFVEFLVHGKRVSINVFVFAHPEFEAISKSACALQQRRVSTESARKFT